MSCLSGFGTIEPTSFTPSGVDYFALTNVSASIPLPSIGTLLTLLVTNLGPASANFALGNNTIVVSPTIGIPIQPGQSVSIPQGLFTNMAAIAGGNPTTLLVQSGFGIPKIVYTVAPPAIPPSPGSGNTLDFSNPANSGYIALISGI